MTDYGKTQEIFKSKFGGDCSVYVAPGRVNLIGEHTDYNDGFVLPGSIDKCIVVGIKPNGTDVCRAYSVDYDESCEFTVTQKELPEKFWARYIYGVVQELIKLGKKPGGFDCAFGGDIPLGAGLSSSAALESVFALALNDLFSFGLDRRALAKVGQMAEHNAVGVRCGIMDQFASLFGEKGKLIKLDCRSLEFELVPFNPKGYQVFLIDTQVKHSLASSEYNVRRQQCEYGVEMVAKVHPEVKSLRDVTMDMLREAKGQMDESTFTRCKYVIEENIRLQTACEALAKDDYETFGKMMFGSHDGLSKEYNVSCEELDFLADFARSNKNILGARMMGGGFGGCTINIIKQEAYDDFVKEAYDAYVKKFGKEPRVFPVVISDGARKLA